MASNRDLDGPLAYPTMPEQVEPWGLQALAPNPVKPALLFGLPRMDLRPVARPDSRISGPQIMPEQFFLLRPRARAKRNTEERPQRPAKYSKRKMRPSEILLNLAAKRLMRRKVPKLFCSPPCWAVWGVCLANVVYGLVLCCGWS